MSKSKSQGKPKEPVRQLLDAGFGAVSPAAPAWASAGLPFDPAAYAVDSGALADRLQDVTDVSLLHRMQAFDTRTTAAAEYERRINALAAEE